MNSLIGKLAALRRRYDREADPVRLRLLKRAAARPLERDDLLAYHEELLFLCAYPPGRAVLALAQRELRRVARFAARPERREFFKNTGIDSTEVEHIFTAEMLAWLGGRRNRALNLAWRDESAGDALDELLFALALPLEADGLLDTACSTRRWLALAAGRRGDAEVRWLANGLLALPLPLVARDRLVESLDLAVRFVPGRDDSRTFARFPTRPLFLQTEPLLRDAAPPALLETPLSARPATRRLPRSIGSTEVPAPLPARVAQRVIDVARAALCVRLRETDPVTYANANEVWLLRLERGIDIAIIGMTPERRLPIESYFGYVAARNRVPIAYGGGWVLFDRCEIGVNLFDTFRGGESSYIFAQILRAYRQLFDVRAFQVDPFQFGADNEEAIRSGAFWFYYRLGFRPRQPILRRLAEAEADRIRRAADYRSPPRTLRRLARCHLVMPVPGFPVRADHLPVPDLQRVGLALTRWIGHRFAGDRRAAAQHSLRRMRAALGVTDRTAWPRLEQDALERFAPLLAMIPGLARWPAADKSLLVRVVRAKGGPHECEYVRALQRHERLREALIAIARAGC